MAALLIAATPALRPNSFAATRRQALVGGGLAASTAALPAAAAPAWDLIGAYNMGGKVGDVGGGAITKPKDGKSNQGILLLRECFDGNLPVQGLLQYYEENLADDFKASFEGGKIILDKPAYLAVTADILKSFPDFIYTRQGPIAYANSPTTVTWTAVVKGTHTGAPYAPLPGVPPVSPKNPPVACENDPEKITVNFASGTKPPLTKIVKLTVEAIPGGKGFSGPIGFYLQAGGDASKLPPPP